MSWINEDEPEKGSKKNDMAAQQNYKYYLKMMDDSQVVKVKKRSNMDIRLSETHSDGTIEPVVAVICWGNSLPKKCLPLSFHQTADEFQKQFNKLFGISERYAINF
jgi:hypothetical protein